MKKLIYLIIFVSFFSCKSEKNPIFDTPQKVIITGKIYDYHPSLMEVEFAINNPGFLQDEIYASFDSTGYFKATFEIYHPTDIWLIYRTNVLILVHPGDSINIEFDGSKNDRSELLESIKFEGNASKINQEAAAFQKLFYSNPINKNNDLIQKALKDYDVKTYSVLIDSIRQINTLIYSAFIKEYSPDREVSIWANSFVSQWHLNMLSEYPLYHQILNNLSPADWDVTTSYYTPLLDRLSINDSILIGGNAVSDLIIRYLSFYFPKAIRDEEQNLKYINKYGNFAPPSEIRDSIFVDGIIRLTSDNLFCQMVLTKYFSDAIENLKIEKYEKFESIIDSIIKEPYLREPLSNLYTRTKDKLENPQLASDAVLKKLTDSSAKQIIDTIFSQNKGNVLYIDCWSTSCGPCISEMPNSRDLMRKMNGKEISFIYLCLDSEEKSWKSWLNKLELGGQHYLLDRKQSNDIRNSFEIKGIPFYILINKDGSIVEKGSHLRPSVASQKIEKLLNE